jgi:hypothetical protein
MNFSDRREAERFPCNVAVEMNDDKGLTRDCSTSGVYFLTDKSLAVAQKVDFVLLIETARVRCCGDVVRVETSPDGTGVAIALTSFAFDGTHTLHEAQPRMPVN